MGTLGTDYYHAWQDALSAVEADTGYMRSKNGQALQAALKAAALEKKRGLRNTKGDEHGVRDKKDANDDDDDEDDDDDDDDEDDDDEDENEDEDEDDEDEDDEDEDENEDGDEDNEDENDENENDEEDNDEEEDDKEPISVDKVRSITNLRTLAKHNRPPSAIDEEHEYHTVRSDGVTTLAQIARVHKCEPSLLTLLNRCKSSCPCPCFPRGMYDDGVCVCVRIVK